LHRKYSILLKHSEALKSQNHLKLIKLQKEHECLLKQNQLLCSQQMTVLELIKSLQICGLTDRAGLFSVQRKLAVLRRQLLALTQQQQTIDEKIKQNIQMIIDAKMILNATKRKVDKYIYLQQDFLSKRALQLNQQDESEMEEIILWRK